MSNGYWIGVDWGYEPSYTVFAEQGEDGSWNCIWKMPDVTVADEIRLHGLSVKWEDE